jgi:hypothetical protein
VGVPVVDTVTTTGVSPQNALSKYTSPPEGTELIEKYPCSLPGAGSVTGTASVTGTVVIMAEDTATEAASISTIIRMAEDLNILLPPTAITEHAVPELFQTADSPEVRIPWN